MKIRVPVISALELTERYGAGEREFSEALLGGANLKGAELRGAVLRNADLRGAELDDATLVEATLIGADLRNARLIWADLSLADLSGADLSGASMVLARASQANLSGANLSGANLSSGNFRGVNFSGADLSGANMMAADLSTANLSGAKLDIVDLSTTNLSSADLGCKPLGRPILSLDPQQVFSLLQSTFISYGGPDESFARKLNDALERRGVTTFFFKDDAPAGEKLHRVMRKGINEHDRVILVCSESSLQRPGLLNELEETLARESRDGGRTYLLPVRLDDYVFNGWKPADPDVARTVRDRVIADFREHEDPAQFDAEVFKLVAVLKRARPVAHL